MCVYARMRSREGSSTRFSCIESRPTADTVKEKVSDRVCVSANVYQDVERHSCIELSPKDESVSEKVSACNKALLVCLWCYLGTCLRKRTRNLCGVQQEKPRNIQTFTQNKALRRLSRPSSLQIQE